MSDETRNPFEGMDQNTSPTDLLRALVDRATITNQVGPMGAALGLMQKEMEGILNHLQGALGGIGQRMSQNTLMIDLVRLTNALIISILLEKNVISQEEFDAMYDERVEKVMAKHVEDIRRETEEMMAERQAAMDAIEAAEETPEVVTSPKDIPKPEPLQEAQPIEDDEPILASERAAAETGSNIVEFKNRNDKTD